MNHSRMLGWIVSAGLCVSLLLGCSLYRNDRAWVSPEKYEQAHRFYVRTGSIDLTERHLHDLRWTTGEINETIYRLGKEFEVLPEELPPATE